MVPPKNAIQAHGSDACLAHLLAHTIGIVNGIRTVGIDPATGQRADSEETGTGFPIKWGERHLILTAAHVLEKATTKDLRFMIFGDASVRFKEPSQITLRDTAEALVLRHPASIYRCAWEDLAVVAVHPEEFPHLDYFDLLHNSFDPPEGEWISVCGFPVDHSVRVDARTVGQKTEIDVAIFPTVFSAPVMPTPSAEDITFYFDGLEPSNHFLLGYNIAEMSKQPHGFSGSAALWESDEKHQIWRPNFRFAGTVTHCHRKGTIIRVVRAPLVLRFLKETF